MKKKDNSWISWFYIRLWKFKMRSIYLKEESQKRVMWRWRFFFVTDRDMLVFANEDVALVGYITLTIKLISVNAESFSNTMKRKIARVSELDEENSTYALSAYLIAQLKKNL